MHGGYPQECELRPESERRRERPQNRLAMEMPHGNLATTNNLAKTNRIAMPIKPLGILLMMHHGVAGLQVFFTTVRRFELGSAGFQPACPHARCGLEARTPRTYGHEMARDSHM